MIKTITIFTALLLVSVLAVAKNGAKDFDTIISKYRTTALVEMSVEKTVKLELQGRETKYNGKIYLAKGRFRWENTTPTETLLVFDGKNIWNEQKPAKGFSGPVQVAHGVVDKKTKSQVLISILLGESFTSKAKISKSTKEPGIVSYSIVQRSSELQIKDLVITVKEATKEIQKISYKDELDNLTEMIFTQVKFSSTADNKKFEYHPPKGAQVTNL